MRRVSIILILLFLFTFYSKGQYVPDSADIVKSYKEKITNGKTIKVVGITVMTAGGLTTLISAFKVLESFGANTTADHFFIMGLVTTLIGIPITIIGVHTQKSNERK